MDTKVEDAWAKESWHNEIAAAAYALAAKSINDPSGDEFLAEFKVFDRSKYYGSWVGAKDLYYNQSIVLLMHLDMPN